MKVAIDIYQRESLCKCPLTSFRKIGYTNWGVGGIEDIPKKIERAQAKLESIQPSAIFYIYLGELSRLALLFTWALIYSLMALGIRKVERQSKVVG